MLRFFWECPENPTYEGFISYNRENCDEKMLDEKLVWLFNTYLTVNLNLWYRDAERPFLWLKDYIVIMFPFLLRTYVSCLQIKIAECHVQRLTTGTSRKLTIASLTEDEVFLELYINNAGDKYLVEVLMVFCSDWRTNFWYKDRNVNLPRC